jgi:hypothetical protein
MVRRNIVDKLSMKAIADDLVTSIKTHVSDRLGPFQSKMDAHAVVNGELSRRLDELEARLADAERKLALKVAA